MDDLNNLKDKCALARKFFLELDRKKPDNGSTESSTFPECQLKDIANFVRKNEKLTFLSV
jgi:hypothetical protein